MSKKMNGTTTSEAVEEKKIQTKYDKKVERRKQEAEKEKREKRRNCMIGIGVVVLLVAFVASFPIRSAIALQKPFVTINGEAVTQVEFDYNRALAKANFLNENSSYFSMFGLDMSIIETQMYNEQLSFADYFDQLAIEQIIDTRSLRDAGKAAGFVYDTSEDYADTIANIKEMAKEQETSYSEYIKNIYGPLATEKRLKSIMNDNFYAVAYGEKVEEEKMPSDEEILAYYEINKANYDSVDYHVTTIKAELPTTAPDGTVPTDEEGNEIPYEPTEEEIQKAMEEAYVKAEEATKTVAKEGDEYINQSPQGGYIHNQLNTFLYEEGRKPGDTYIAKNEAFNSYVVGSFEGRRRDDSPTHNARIIITFETPSQTILDEWNAGEATEERFIELFDKYDEADAVVDGLFEGVSVSVLDEEVGAWLSASERKAGDTFAKDVEGDANYVIYYLGSNEPQWKLSIRNLLVAEEMTEYVEGLVANYTVEDPDKKLKYLTIQEAMEETENTTEEVEE